MIRFSSLVSEQDFDPYSFLKTGLPFRDLTHHP